MINFKQCLCADAGLIRTETYLCAMFYRWFIFLLAISAGAAAQTTQVYRQNELYGLSAKKILTPAVYDTLIAVPEKPWFIARRHHSSQGINAYGVLTDKGKILIPFTYAGIATAGDNFIVKQWTSNQLRYGVVTAAHKILLPIRFNFVQLLPGQWAAGNPNHSITLYAIDGKPVSTLQADSIFTSEVPGYYHIMYKGKQGMVSHDGRLIIATDYKKVSYKNGQWQPQPFSKWQLLSSQDTLTIQADSVLLWNAHTRIEKVNQVYFTVHKNKRVGLAYQHLQPVCRHLAISRQSAKYGAITQLGEQRLPNRFGQLKLVNGYFYGLKNNAWHVYDSLGKKRSVFSYDSIGAFANGLFPVKRKGKWGFMDRNGKEVIHCIYDHVAGFYKGMALITYFGSQGIIDLSGKWMVKPLYQNITGYGYHFFVYYKNGLYYLKNFEDKLVYFSANPLVFKDETIYEIAPTAKDQISTRGTKVLKNSLMPNTAAHWKIIKVGNKFGFTDTQGLLKITYRYDSLKPFSEGLAPIKLRGKWGFIDSLENIAVQPIYSKVGAFKAGFSVVFLQGKAGLISKTGKYILKPEFDSITPVSPQLWRVKLQGYYGIFNEKGHVIIQPNYEGLTYISEEVIIVKKNGKYGVVNSRGVSILPRVYDYIGYDKQQQTLITKRGSPR